MIGTCFRKNCVSLAVLLCLVACGNSGLGPWREEVQISDGRIVVVERYEEAVVHQPIADVGAAFLTGTTIKFAAPPELSMLPTLSMVYRPILLDFDADRKQWSVVGVNERACRPTPEQLRAGHLDSTGRINVHPNIEYRLIDGKWQEVEIGPERLGRAANLLINRSTVQDWKVLPIAEKKRLDSGRQPDSFRSVLPRIGC